MGESEVESYSGSLRPTDIGAAIRQTGAFVVNQDSSNIDGLDLADGAEKKSVRSLVQRFRQGEKTNQVSQPPMPFQGQQLPVRMRQKQQQQQRVAPYYEQQQEQLQNFEEEMLSLPQQQLSHQPSRNSMVEYLSFNSGSYYGGGGGGGGGEIQDPSAILGGNEVTQPLLQQRQRQLSASMRQELADLASPLPPMAPLPAGVGTAAADVRTAAAALGTAAAAAPWSSRLVPAAAAAAGAAADVSGSGSYEALFKSTQPFLTS